MRIMQIAHLHPDYTPILAAINANKTTHAACVQGYLDDGYWAGHTLTPALTRMGHETFLCVPDAMSQQLWCQENDVEWVEKHGEIITCLIQIAKFKPDVLYIGSILHFYDDFLQLLTYRPKIIVGWHATHNQPYLRMNHYDLVLSSHGECLDFAKSMGARHAAYSYPGFSTELMTQFSPTKHTDLCFAGGYWSTSHPQRNRFLSELAEQIAHMGIDCHYHLGVYLDSPKCPCIVLRYNRGPVWGRAMLKAFASSRITLNAFCSITGMPQSISPNMRQLEGMGMGSLMLTENSPNLEAFFREDKDLITFRDVPELIEKTLHYLHAPEEREKIVAYGQQTCKNHFAMAIRAKAFMDKVHNLLDTQTPLPIAVIVRTLNALAGPSKDNPDILDKEDIALFIHTILNIIPDITQTDPDAADAILAALEPLPFGQGKNIYFCNALRALRRRDTQEAQHWLHKELRDFPENDRARQFLSDILLKGISKNL